MSSGRSAGSPGVLIIAGRLHVHPENRDRDLAERVEVETQARSAPGRLDLAADLIGPTRIDVFERWGSDETPHAFRGSGPEGAQADQILDADVRRYRISTVEPR